MYRRSTVAVVLVALVLALSGCASTTSTNSEPAPAASVTAAITGHLELDYASQYDVAYLDDGSFLLTIGGSDQYVLEPSDSPAAKLPATDEDAITHITIPVHDAYLAASSAMDFFVRLDTLDSVRMTSTQQKDWSLPEVTQALDDGHVLYVGKYSSPDYERVLEEGAGIAIESTMVYHCPEVAERLQALGIPVLVERSSYEASPLGRLEWIKLYGLLTGHLDEAEELFAEQVEDVEQPPRVEEEGRPSVAFFSIGANGHVVVRKPGDYVSQMIGMAGGRYFLDADDATSEADTSALSTMSMEMESFYEAARDADVIIYNSAIDDELQSVDDLLAKNERLADFAAVRNGRVWCTGKDLFQQPTCVAQMVQEMSMVFLQTSGDAEDDVDFEHLYHVQ